MFALALAELSMENVEVALSDDDGWSDWDDDADDELLNADADELSIFDADISEGVQEPLLETTLAEDFLSLYRVNGVGAYQAIRACRSLLEAAPQPGAGVAKASEASKTERDTNGDGVGSREELQEAAENTGAQRHGSQAGCDASE